MASLGSHTDVISYAERGCEDASEMPGDSPDGEMWGEEQSLLKGISSELSLKDEKKPEKLAFSQAPPSCLPPPKMTAQQVLPKTVQDPVSEQGRASVSWLCLLGHTSGYGAFPVPTPVRGPPASGTATGNLLAMPQWHSVTAHLPRASHTSLVDL